MKHNSTNPVTGLTIPLLYLAACQTETIFVDEIEWTYFSNYVSYSWFIIKDDFTITAFGPSAPKIFKCDSDALLHSDFEQLLLHGAAHHWKQLGAAIRKGRLSGMTMHQQYKSADGRVLDSISTLCNYKETGLLIKIHIPLAFKADAIQMGVVAQRDADLSETDRMLVMGVRDYILSHLDDRLPSTKALSQMFYTNEYTLKLRFRQVNGYSIYKYFNIKRLDRAHEWISKGSYSLQDIAVMSGFSTYRNFSTAFKKHTGLSPKAILRGKG